MLAYRRAKVVFFLSSVSILFALINVLPSHSERIANTSESCADLVMLFARGSSSNPESLNTDLPFDNVFKDGVPDPGNPGNKIGGEEIPGAFFQWMEKRLIADYPHIDYKAISIHNSGNMWSANGYPAVGIFNPSTINNIFDAEFYWWPAGEYRGSVRSGMDELKGQVNYEAMRCPNQRIVIGGYSQGANVVGDALFEIPMEQRNLIDNVVLFGDPKFIGAEYNKLNLLDKPKVYPWHRGTAGLRERGVNDARVPYVPDDMKYKTISWCHEDDFVCTGFSGLGWGITNHGLPSNDNSIWQGPKGALGDGHTRYPVYGVPEATEEVLANLKHHLATLEIERGGLDPKTDSFRKVYDGTLKNTRPVDIMFALNNTGGIEDAHSQYYLNLKKTLNQYKTNFPNMQTGSVVYTDMLGGTGANKSSVAAYTHSPRQLSASNDSMFASSVYMYGIGGGGDYPENHGMAIERSGMFANWRDDARKHIVLFAERPALETYSFDMCNSSIVSILPHTGEIPCLPGRTFNTSTQAEWCYNIYHTLAGTECPYIGQATSNTIISRTLEDAVLLARSKGITVDIIQPHRARNNQPGYAPDAVSAQLRKLAESTGGLYLLYEDQAFGEAQLRDAIWQILNHDPQIMRTTGYVPGSLLAFSSDVDLAPYDGIARIATLTPTLIRTTPVSGAQSYGWDYNGDGVEDDLTDGPATEVTLPSAENTFVRVTAYSSPNGTNPLSTSSLPVIYTEPEQNTYIPTNTPGLEGLHIARENGSTRVAISWSTGDLGEYDIVIVRDPISGVPVGTVPALNGTVEYDLGEAFGDSVSVQLVRPGAEADVQIVQIEMPSPPTDEPVDKENVPDPEDGVGLTGDKVVSQNEQNSSGTTQPRPQTSPVTSTPSAAVSSASTPTVIPAQRIVSGGSSSSTQGDTVVLAAQDVNTNPQDNVGGVEDVNTLFPGEIEGSDATYDIDGSRGINIWFVLLIVVGVFGLLLLLIILFKKKETEEDEEKDIDKNE